MRPIGFALALLCAGGAAVAAPPAPSPAVKRLYIAQGRKSGSSVTTVAPDGTIAVVFDVLQNGRGPHVDATVRLAPDGTIAALHAVGHHEMGTKVDETFTRQGRHVSWKSEEEHGARDLDGPAFFVPIADLPEIEGLLVQALLKNGGTLAIVPGGTARLQKATELTVSAGGKSRRLIGYDITGLELTPTRVWMNDDGSWFGVVSPWSSLVPEGWESVAPTLVAKQEALGRAADAKLAATEAHKPPAAGLAYTHARVLDV